MARRRRALRHRRVRVESSMLEQCGGIAKSSGKVCKCGRLVRHGMTLGTKRASAVGISKAVS
ncbi:hypothetical protein HAX54_046337, partial [Datura stramonium]|nr:hypothetical protein [Datura stramonium]